MQGGVYRLAFFCVNQFENSLKVVQNGSTILRPILNLLNYFKPLLNLKLTLIFPHIFSIPLAGNKILK